MYKGYQSIFWGMFFASFHINLSNIEILPLFVAWIIVANGINKLNEVESGSFSKAKIFALITAGLSFVSGLITLTYGSAADGIILPIILPTVIGIMELLTEYKILQGTVEYLSINDNIEMVQEYTKKMRNYTIFFIIFLTLECIAISSFMEELIVVVAIFGLILRIWFMYTISNLKKLYEEDI